MPANVDSMFSVREMPWHREGTVLQDYPGSWAEARTIAGLDWEPELAPVYQEQVVHARGGESYDQDVLDYKQIPGFNLIRRSDTGAILSVRPESYTLITHEEMGGIVEAVLKQDNVKWETAGSLNGGKAVWCLCKLDEPVVLPGDSSPTLPYLGITNHHDGTGACALRTTAVRIVCANTFGAAEAEGERTGTTFSFVHRSSWREHMDEAREAVMNARRQFGAYLELAEDLLQIPVTTAQTELFVRLFIPEPPETMITDRVARNIEAARQAVRGILASVTMAEVPDSAYKLVQAGVEYLDHARTARTWETRLGRTLLRPEPLKQRAITLAREVATVDA